MKTVGLLTVIATALCGCSSVGINRAPAGAAAGGTAPSSASASFIAADVNGDARISPQEYNARGGGQPQSFDAADTNGDGVLTFDEWQDLMSPRRAAGAFAGPRR